MPARGARHLTPLSRPPTQPFERADDAFEPHLTLGRVRTPSDWTARLIDAQIPEARLQIDRLWLVKSTLGAGGSRYEKLVEVPLA